MLCIQMTTSIKNILYATDADEKLLDDQDLTQPENIDVNLDEDMTVVEDEATSNWHGISYTLQIKVIVTLPNPHLYFFSFLKH